MPNGGLSALTLFAYARTCGRFMRLWIRDELYSALTHALEDSPGLLTDLVGGSGERSSGRLHVSLSLVAAKRISAFVNHLGDVSSRGYFGTLTPAELKQQWSAVMAAASESAVTG